MIATDEEALMCDFAETYHIYDYRSLPLSRAAVFAVGLRENSRIKMKMRGTEYSLKEILLATIADKAAFLVWSKTKDAEHGRNFPKSILADMLGMEADKDVESFVSSEDFERRKREILDGGE